MTDKIEQDDSQEAQAKAPIKKKPGRKKKTQASTRRASQTYAKRGRKARKQKNIFEEILALNLSEEQQGILLHILYALVMLSLVLFSLIPALLGLGVLLIFMRHKVAGTVDEHLQWLLRTYILGCGSGVIIFLLGIMVGLKAFWIFLLIFIIPLYLWAGLRCLHGWLRHIKKEVPSNPQSWLL